MDFKGFPKLVSLWKGIVRVDLSLAANISSTLDYSDYRIVTIKDSKYSHADNAQLDNMHGEIDFPNEIVTFVIGNEILERMWCTVVKGYKEKPRQKLLQRSFSTYKSLSCKGFILEPVSANDDTKYGESSCLGLFQFDNDFGNEIAFDRLGMYIFTSGSQTSNMTFVRDQRKSVTAAFISSRDKPIIAYIYSRDKTLRFFGDDSGTTLSEVHVNKQNVQQHLNPTTKKDALNILKTRLATGEISIEEYHNLRRIIQEDEDYTSNWI